MAGQGVALLEFQRERARLGEHWAHRLRDVLQTVSKNESFRQCGKPWRNWVEVIEAPSGDRRHHGVHTCTSCWLCPVCWTTRRWQERGELVFAAEQWFASGGGLATATLTVPHGLGEPLVDVLGRLDDMAGTLRNGAGLKALRRFGVEGVYRATEMTYGGHGWHPHQHQLLWLARPLTPETEAGLREWWEGWRRRHWERKRNLPYYRPETDPYGPYGVPGGKKPKRDLLPDVRHVEPANIEPVATHITKGPSTTTEDRYYQALRDGNLALAQYLAPFAIGLQAAEEQDVDGEAQALWDEYSDATLGMHWARWPRGGFRDRFGFGPAGKAPALEGERVGFVHREEWPDANLPSGATGGAISLSLGGATGWGVERGDGAE